MVNAFTTPNRNIGPILSGQSGGLMTPNRNMGQVLIDSAQPTFTPQSTIQQRRNVGQALMKQALAPQANVSGLSPFAALAQGLAGGFMSGRANRLETQNQQARQQALQGVLGLDPSEIGPALVRSGDPGLQKLGVGAILKAGDRATQDAFTERKLNIAEAAERRAQGEADRRRKRQDKIFAMFGGQPDGQAATEASTGGVDLSSITPGESAALRIAIDKEDAGTIAKIMKSVEARSKQSEQKAIASNIVSTDIRRIVDVVQQTPDIAGFSATTGFLGGQVLNRLGGTPAKNVSRLLDTVRANVGFERLNQMRASSPTGAGLGNVTEREMQLLSNVLGSLEQDQTREQLLFNLQRLDNVVLDIVHGEGNGPARHQLGPVSTPKENALPSPDQRQVGDTTTTAKGTFRWNGQGWEPVQ